MVSLKMSKAEAKAEGYGSPAELKPPEYPWGTRITLVDEVAHALFPKMPTVGGTVAIEGKAMIASVNIVQQEGGKSRVSIELQLTDLECEDPGEDEGVASKLYGKDGPRKAAD